MNSALPHPESIPPDRWIRRLDRALAVAAVGEDPEGVHQVRVATRRLVTWLDLAGQRVLRDDLLRLRRSISGLRDLDVLLGRALPPAFEAWVRERWQNARQAVPAPARAQALLRALSLLPPLPRGRAEAGLRRLCEHALRAGQVLEDQPTIEELHRLRRRLRPVRYALDWLDLPSAAVRAVQDAVGVVVDAHVALDLLREWGGDAPAFARNLQAETDPTSVLVAWPAARGLLVELCDPGG